MALNIRKAVASDYDGLCALFEQVDSLHTESLPHVFQKPNGVVRDRDYIFSLIHDEAVALFVAEIGENLVGLACVRIRETPDIPIFVQRRYAVLEDVVVAEAHRRAGIGQQLVEVAHAWGVAQGVESMELNVWEFNQGAIAFYQGLGYETMSRRMCKRLTGT